MSLTIYDDAIAAGIKTDHHESDLYLPDIPEARAIIAKHGKRVDGHNVSRFISQTDGKPWLEIVFGFMPYWRRKESP